MKHLLLYSLVLFLTGCKLTIPEPLVTLSCYNTNTLLYTVDNLNSHKYTFMLSDNAYIKYPISWYTSTGTYLGSSNTNSFSYTFAFTGPTIVRASYQNSCNDLILTFTNSFTIK